MWLPLHACSFIPHANFAQVAEARFCEAEILNQMRLRHPHVIALSEVRAALQGTSPVNAWKPPASFPFT